MHNLHKMNWELPLAAYPWASEFGEKAKQIIEARDTEKLVTPDRWGEGLLANAHSTLEQLRANLVFHRGHR